MASDASTSVDRFVECLNDRTALSEFAFNKTLSKRWIDEFKSILSLNSLDEDRGWSTRQMTLKKPHYLQGTSVCG